MECYFDASRFFAAIDGSEVRYLPQFCKLRVAPLRGKQSAAKKASLPDNVKIDDTYLNDKLFVVTSSHQTNVTHFIFNSLLRYCDHQRDERLRTNYRLCFVIPSGYRYYRDVISHLPVDTIVIEQKDNTLFHCLDTKTSPLKYFVNLKGYSHRETRLYFKLVLGAIRNNFTPLDKYNDDPGNFFIYRKINSEMAATHRGIRNLESLRESLEEFEFIDTCEYETIAKRRVKLGHCSNLIVEEGAGLHNLWFLDRVKNLIVIKSFLGKYGSQYSVGYVQLAKIIGVQIDRVTYFKASDFRRTSQFSGSYTIDVDKLRRSIV
jgi:hypothetical protein